MRHKPPPPSFPDPTQTNKRASQLPTSLHDITKKKQMPRRTGIAQGNKKRKQKVLARPPNSREKDANPGKKRQKWIHPAPSPKKP